MMTNGDNMDELVPNTKSIHSQSSIYHTALHYFYVDFKFIINSFVSVFVLPPHIKCISLNS